MKAWAHDHPKAKLMARKRSAILVAAREHFLRTGYEGSSMEAIAAAAEVSIMTLYRHAASKDELFAGVVQAACEHSPQEMAAAAQAAKAQPISEVLTRIATLFQQKILHPDTVALMRVVMMENNRFPELAQAVYQEYVQAWQSNLLMFVADRSDLHSLSEAAFKPLIAQFFDDLLSTDLLRAFLGLSLASSAQQQEQRSQLAVQRFLATVRTEN